MDTKDFFTKLNSQKISENIEKQFGSRVNLTNYSREQLEDYRNKLRTKVFQQENQAGFNELLANETYHKTKAMLDLLNTRIKEMLGEDIKKLRDKMDELSEAKKGVKAPKYTKKAKGTDQTGDGQSNFDDVQVARMVAGGVPKKKAIAKATTDNFKEGTCPTCHEDPCQCDEVKEGFPTVDDAKKAHAEKGTTRMKVGDKQKSSTGGEITKTATGLRHTAGKNYGGLDAPKTPDSDKKAKKASEGLAGRVVGTKVGSAVGKTAGTAAGAYYGGGKLSVAKAGKEVGGKIGGEIGGEIGDRGEDFVKSKFGKKKSMKESQAIFKSHVRMVNESLAALLAEDEEGKAKAITSAGDIVNDFTSWMQRVGQFQTKAMIELADAIKADFGAQEAETFKQTVAPALAATLETLTTQREAIGQAVAVLAGEAVPAEPMGAEAPAMPPEEPGMDAAAPDELNAEPTGDEFGAADAAGSSREMRESKFARKLAESHSIMSKLAK
jgi:hypothetical protein